MLHAPLIHRARRGALACAIARALCGLAAAAPLALFTIPAAAQQGETMRNYSIPAGPMGATLNRFGREAGIMLSFSSQATEKLRSPGVSGVHTPASGLAALLKGSGLAASRQGNGGYAVAAAPSEAQGDSAAMPMVHVVAQGQGTATEDTGSYTGRAATIGKMEQSLRETPQSVSVITRQFMDDRNLVSLDEVIAQATGTTRSQRNFGSHTFVVRGFAMNTYLVDGVAGTVFDATGPLPMDMAIYDRVEVLRGAAGLIVGAGDPSGAVNLVRKRPRKEAHANVNLSAGSWENYRAEVDAGGALNEQGTLRGRVVAAYQDKHAFQDVTHARMPLLYAVLEADLGRDTTVMAGVRRQENTIDGYTVFGLPRYSDGRALDVPRATSMAQDWNRHEAMTNNVFAELEHRFGGDWKATIAANYNNGGYDQKLGITRGAVNPATLRGASLYTRYFKQLDVETSGVDASVTGSFQAWGGSHRMMAGVNWNEMRQYGYEVNVPGSVAVDVFNVNHGALPEPARPAWTTNAKTSDLRYGAYASARLELAAPLHLLLGGRMSWQDYRQVNRLTGARTADYRQDHEFTPYAGLVYDIDRQWSAYASYTDTFQVQSAYLTASGAPLKPAVGANYEAGVKGELYGGRLNLSAAVFKIRKDDVAVLDTASLGLCPGAIGTIDCYRNGSTLRSKGVEFEASGELAPGWQLMAGYTYVSSRDDAGKSISSETPHHLFKASTSYRLPGALAAWQVGAGVSAQSGYAFPADDNPAVTMGEGGRALCDLNASYRINGKWSAQVNVNNVFDRSYYAMLGTLARGNYYGEPRSVSLMLRASL